MKTWHRYDVFLSHNSREEPVVERIAEKLRMATRNLTKEEWKTYFGGRAYSKTCPSLP